MELGGGWLGRNDAAALSEAGEGSYASGRLDLDMRGIRELRVKYGVQFRI